jgi:uncharacterized protein YukE
MATDYDRAGDSYISPSGLNKTAKELGDLAQNVADSINRIKGTLDQLALGWAGKTQQEANDFTNRWSEVMRDLFGTDGDPNRGVLNCISNQVATAAGNYNLAEGGLVDAWSKFTADGSSTPPAVPPDEMDTNKTFITADYPPS